ncbi:hypothetical protein C2G38_2094661 [Gigaspora rosea]|uniref:Uncharacterized protein n=1 Tax=Gigaspora rosea TaxID=44941 RepID=A0A397UX95_9GLOM|nr:hypothetical protein C2G38_2094661 [Gigaspora rosea]
MCGVTSPFILCTCFSIYLYKVHIVAKQRDFLFQIYLLIYFIWAVDLYSASIWKVRSSYLFKSYLQLNDLVLIYLISKSFFSLIVINFDLIQ